MTNHTPFSEGFVNGRAYEQARVTRLLEREASSWRKPVQFSYRSALRDLVERIKSSNSIDQLPHCDCGVIE